MTHFRVFSKGCTTCKDAIATLKAAVAERDCGCDIEEVTCDGQCDAAQKLGFAGHDRPVIVRDDEVVHEGVLSKEVAFTLLPAA